jgi:hypothetical protein
MSLYPRWGLLALFVLFWLGLPAAARAEHGVADRAGLFKSSTCSEADELIDDIRRRVHKELLIETLSSNLLSAEEMTEYGKKDAAGRRQFIRDLAAQRAARRQVNGVYVLICAEPHYEKPRGGVSGFFQRIARDVKALAHPEIVGHAVVVWPESNDSYFPEDDRKQLNRILAGDTGSSWATEKDRDKILLNAVKFADETLEANARALGAPPADTFHWTDALWAAAALVVAWIVLGLVRARLAVRQGTPGPVPGANTGLAALFGTAGVLWLFAAYQARGTEAPAPPAQEPEAAEPEPPPEEIPMEGPMHPDDLDAIARGPQEPV